VGVKLLYLAFEIGDIEGVLFLLVGETFLLLLQRLEGLVALPPAGLQLLPLSLLLSSTFSYQFLEVLLADLPLEDDQLLLQHFGFVV
jgi:hypothetical protein